jgi:hypothetical protein
MLSAINLSKAQLGPSISPQTSDSKRLLSSFHSHPQPGRPALQDAINNCSTNTISPRPDGLLVVIVLNADDEICTAAVYGRDPFPNGPVREDVDVGLDAAVVEQDEISQKFGL